MNISGLKIDKAEYKNGCIDMTLRNTKSAVRIAVKSEEMLPDLIDSKEYTLTLDEQRTTDKWSKSSLHYVWALINRIGNLLGTSKEEEYKILLERYSQGEIVVKPVVEFNYPKYYEVLDNRVVENTPIIICKVWKGISEMDAHELNIFVDGVISECKELDIDTSTPSDITYEY